MKIALLALAIACCSCGSDLEGRWRGTHVGDQSATAFSNAFSLVIWDDGENKARGVWVSIIEDDPAADADIPFGMGSVEITRDGDLLTISFDQDGTRCQGSHTGSFEISGDTIEGDITGTTADVDPTSPNPLPGGIACGAATAEIKLERIE